MEVIFPKKLDSSNIGHFNTSFITSSIFGYHTASAIDSDNFLWPHDSTDDYNFQLYAVRTHKESKDVHFQISASNGAFNLTSSIYSNVYDNQKWNFAVRFKDAKWPYSTGITGSGVANDVRMELIGYNTEYGIVKDQFSLTASSLNDKFLTAPRRYYAGASRTNYSGSVVAQM